VGKGFLFHDSKNIKGSAKNTYFCKIIMQPISGNFEVREIIRKVQTGNYRES
jgi:hypothetical protein